MLMIVDDLTIALRKSSFMLQSPKQKVFFKIPKKTDLCGSTRGLWAYSLFLNKCNVKLSLPVTSNGQQPLQNL